MREVELKAVVPDLAQLRARLVAAGAVRAYVGKLTDWRYDTADEALDAADHVLRLRLYEPQGEESHAVLDRKGPTRYENGYKVRDEESTPVVDLASQVQRLRSDGYHVTQRIDREIEVFEFAGATLRIEQYPRLDVLLEVEGTEEAIERAIAGTGIPRASFTAGRLTDFVAAYEQRTGQPAAVSVDTRT